MFFNQDFLKPILNFVIQNVKLSGFSLQMFVDEARQAEIMKIFQNSGYFAFCIVRLHLKYKEDFNMFYT